MSHDSRFEDLMREAMRDTEHFGHRQHIKLTWLAVLQYGADEATRLISSGIRRTARYAGAPQKYNSTVSRAWVELVSHHAAEAPHRDFDEFVEVNPALLDKRLLSRFYRSATLACANARSGWVEPDLDDFPWR
ncbi:hypothetical protein [Pseudonocardia spinosispora]|uniref:hypothetical protein n=1 Tax=Pseudonocardia spinosispora TaxID=103441 RepID=UPI00041D796D|nr:hypothetical protein [Pseudonocardia spinosispora]